MREQELVEELLRCREPGSFAVAYRDVRREASVHRTLIREAARVLARGLDWSSTPQGSLCFLALVALQAVDQAHPLVPPALRSRMLGHGLWFVAQQVELTPLTVAVSWNGSWDGAGPFTAALEAGDRVSAGRALSRGIADPVTRKAVAEALLTFLLTDLTGAGIAFVGTLRVLEMAESMGWRAADEFLLPLAHVACRRHDRETVSTVEGWIATHGTRLNELPAAGRPPTPEDLAMAEEGLREGGSAAVEALVAVAHRSQGLAALWESVLLAFSRLIQRAGPRTMIDAAMAFSYVVAARAAWRHSLKPDRRTAAFLLPILLFGRLQKAVAAEPVPRSPDEGPHPSLDRALDARDAPAAWQLAEDLIAGDGCAVVTETLACRATQTDNLIAFVSQLHYVCAAVSAYESSHLPTRSRYLSTAASFIARTQPASEVQAQLARVGI
ncbi:MAG: hypothetical protein HY815_21445 [Candidatus Riflebacteria bacterium]|nr:hypothetical protein [Candidatus Riflebacteria bacterium]